MRLLNVHSLKFRVWPLGDAPDYVVASHRWSEADEATIKDIAKKRNTHKSGYKKVEDFAAYIRENINGVDWLWIDTCCVNQDSSQEVSEAVNSMFRWYGKAALCIAFLGDVASAHELRNSSWFRRGWTLQELIAPPLLILVTQSWQVIGHKGSSDGRSGRYCLHTGPSLETVIAEITGIPEGVLYYGEWRKSAFRTDEILEWMTGRTTTKEEDLSYCLFGLLDVSLPVIYGEGKDKARHRLMAEVERNNEVAGAAASAVSGIQGEKPFTHSCAKCDRLFRSKQALDQHAHNSHARRTMFDCRSCNRRFDTQQSLDQHLRNSPNHAAVFACDPCRRQFDSQIALEQHFGNSPAHVNSLGRHDRTRNFGDRRVLRQPRISSSANTAGFGCKACSRTFNSIQALQQHIDDSPDHVFHRVVEDGWGNRANFQASYGSR